MSMYFAFLTTSPVFRGPPKRNRRSLCRATATPPPPPPPSPPPQKDAPVNPTRKTNGAPPIQPSFFEILSERTLDTVDDVKMHYDRFFGEPELDAPPRKKRIVVLGSGWGSHSFLKVAPIDKYEITVVSPRNFYFFTPLLAATAVGTIEFRSIVDPIRRANPFVSFYEAACTEIDLKRSEIMCVPVRPDAGSPSVAEFRLTYDYLLISVGERAGTFGVPGVRENAFFLKEITDSVKLRRAIISAFEVAALPGKTNEQRKSKLQFVVVGGGPTGCEFAGELSDFLLSDLFSKFSDLQPFVQVTLLQSRDAILTSFEASLQARALDNFGSRRVKVRVNARVARVTSTAVELVDGSAVPYGVLVWAAGNSPRDVTVQLAKQVNELALNGYQPQPERARKLTVDSWLRVKGADNVFALGDCSMIEDGPLPATAQVAGQQGAYLARAFRKWARIESEKNSKTSSSAESNGNATSTRGKWTEKLRPFSFLSLGAMTYIGNQKAMVQFDTGENAPNIAMAGFISYLLWLSTYAVKQVATRNRILVLFDVFKTKIFGRDVSQF